MKKLSQMFCNLLLMAVIDGLLIYTELGTDHPFQGDTKKILLIAIGDLIWILLVLWGDRLSDAWHTCRISKAADGILLILSAPVMIGAVQMITWLSGKRNKSVNYLGSLLKKVTSLSFMNLIGNLIVCYVILGILILLFRKIKTASAVFCWLLILLALINFFVMEFRGEAFFLLDITGIGTAADVAGEYEFKIPLMLGIPLTYSLVFVQFIQKFQLFDQDRNDQGRHRGDRQDLELLHRLVVRDTGQHDKADRDQHAHVVDQKLRSPGVKIPEKHQHRSQIDRLGSVKIKERGLIHLQVKHREGDKMNGEHQNILSQEQKFPRVLILFFENDIALQRVKSDEHQQNILRNVNNQFCHDFSTPLPV